jgi:hypothetical protein
MSSEFALAFLRGSNYAWRLRLSDERGVEKFIGKNGAIGHVRNLAQDRAIQLVTYGTGEQVESVWFYEPGKPERRLNVLLVGCANAQEQHDSFAPVDFVVVQIRPDGKEPRPWRVISSIYTVPHDGCMDADEAKEWLKNTTFRCPDHASTLLIVSNKDDRMVDAWSVRRGIWLQLSMKVNLDKSRPLYDGVKPESEGQNDGEG